jgi:hypothetical protein
MEKLLIKLSYWLGVICLVVAVLSRLLNAIGIGFAQFSTRGNEVSYRTFLAGAILFLIMAIATESLDSFNKRNP